MHFYRKGETERWDSMIMKPQRGLGITGLASVTIHSMSEKAKAYETQAANERAFGTCTSKPFCDLIGGVYLNAIYENDAALVQRMDRQILGEIRSTPTANALNKFASILYGQGTRVIGAEEGFSLLKLMAIKYMALYESKHIGQSCLLDGARRISRKSEVIVEYEDQFGNDQGAADLSYGEAYVINKEFIPLCTKICDSSGASGADFIADSLNSYKAKLILSGTSQVLSRLDCNDPQVKQFERNLISLTERYLDGSLKNATSQSSHTPSATSYEEQIAYNEERTRIDNKRQAMNAEIISFGRVITEAREAHQKAYYARIRDGVSSEELLKLNKERRDFLKASQLEMRNGINEIKARYW